MLLYSALFVLLVLLLIATFLQSVAIGTTGALLLLALLIGVLFMRI
ncbi:MAG: hypothetical protein WD226_12600 [Planctomycetota bacterium]